jgi:hypothetical protein
MTTAAGRTRAGGGSTAAQISPDLSPLPRRLLRLQHPARFALAVLLAVVAVVAAAAGLDELDLPGWSVPGAVAAFVAYVAAISPLRRSIGDVVTQWNTAVASHSLVRWLSHAVEVIAILARLLLPLWALPVLLMLFAARGLPPWAQSCLGAWAVAVGLLTVHAEQPTLARARAWIGTRHGSRRSPILVVGAYVIVPVAALIVASRESHVVELANHIGGFITWVALIAVALWLLACLFRITAFAASPIRLLGFVPILLVAWRGAAGAGIVPGEQVARRIPLPAWAWILLLGGAVIAMIAANPLHRRFTWETWRHVAAMIEALGFGAALLAPVVFFVAILLSLDASGSYGHTHSAAVRAGERPGTATWARLPSSDQQLADQFAPVLILHRSELWPLTSVETYLRDVSLRSGSVVRAQSVTANGLPTKCTGGSINACFTLTCRIGACDAGRPVGVGSGRGGVEYARVFRLSRRADAAAFIPPRPVGAQQVDAVIEYWLFYRYDRWRAGTAFGVLTQQHGADWEVVTVGVAQRQPVFVAYSAHCAGTWYPWNRTEARTATLFGDDKQRAALHPLVAVALGSHANYARATDSRASDWGSCAHVSRKATDALTFTWNVRDRTSADYELRPAKVDVVKDGQGPTSFAGRWSESDVTSLRNERVRTLASGEGPTSPALKSLWTTPLWTIFRGAWHRGT